MAGLTPQGLERDSVQDIKTRIEAKLLARISPTLDISPESQLGQLIGVFSEEAGATQELIQVAYDAFDPDRAEDAQLVSLAKLTGTVKRAATKSRVEATVTLEAGTTLLAGVHFAHVEDKPQARFTPVEDFTAPSDGEHAVWFEAEEPGPVAAPAGKLTVIASPVVGWSAVTNTNDAELGLPEESNEALRARREQELQSSGNGTVDAIEAAVSKVEGVRYVRCFENTTDATDQNGVPPHAIEVLIFDGISPTGENNDAIAQAIWNTKPAGIRTYGAVPANARDRRGEQQTVYFSRVTPKAVYVEIDVDVITANYVGDSAVSVAFAERANALQSTGSPVRVRLIDSLIYDIPGVVDVTGFRLGFAPGPTGTTNLPVGVREVAVFDSSNVTVTSSEAS